MGFTEESLLKLVALAGVKTGKLGAGDDCDCLEVGDRTLCLNVDGFTAKSVMMEFMDLTDVGWRGVIASLSDLVAKGCRPIGAGFSIYARNLRGAEELSEGALQAIKEYSVTFLGADTNEGEEAIDVASLGTCEDPVPMSGAREGDLVVVPEGCWGCVRACLEGVAGAREREHCKRPKIPKGLVEAIIRHRQVVKASTDSSDSLAVSLWKLAKASGKRLELFQLPNKFDKEYVLYSGEEYLPVLIVDRGGEELIEEVNGVVIGEVKSGPPKVTLNGEEVKPLGWEWF